MERSGTGEGATRSTPHPGPALAVLCAAAFLGVLDTTIVAVALPTIRRDLGFSAADIHWVLNGYTLAFGGLLLLGGRLADVFGRRRAFMTGLAVVAIASLAGGLADTRAALVAARVAQGAGASALIPSALALVTMLFADPARRARAIGVFGAMGSLGFVAGVVLGGALTELLSWRWVLLINLPIALAALAAAPAVVPEDRDPVAPRSLDLAGGATLTLGLAALIAALADAPARGWTSGTTIGLGVLGAGLLAGWVAVECRAAAPLVPLSIFRVRALAVANVAIALKSVVGMAQLYVLTIYFQEALGRTPLAAGLLFVPMAVAGAAAAPIAGALAGRVKDTTAVSASGLLVLAAGLLLVARLPGEGGHWSLLAGTVVAEAGFVLAAVPLTVAATTSLPDADRGLAAGLLNTSTQLGNALGLAATAALVAALGASGEDARPAALTEGLRFALLASVGVVAVTLLLVLVGLRGGAAQPGRAPATPRRSGRTPARPAPAAAGKGRVTRSGAGRWSRGAVQERRS